MMEHIRKAIERARDDGIPGHLGGRPSANPYDPNPRTASPPPAPASVAEVSLDGAYIESKRIIAHDIADARSRSFDMLRTQILQTMDTHSWQFLGVTSATQGCGKSVVAINLALSIARQPERSVLLVDLDLQKPQVANYLGLHCDRGLVSVLAGRTSLQSAMIRAHIRNEQILVLPSESATPNSSAWIASRSMDALLKDIKRDFFNWTVIFDLPPVLSSDDVLTMIPRLDCVAFVVGAGTTTPEEIKECNKHFESAEIVRVILNKSEDPTPSYYYSYPSKAKGDRKDPPLQIEPKDPAPQKRRRKRPRFQRLSRFLTRLSQV